LRWEKISALTAVTRGRIGAMFDTTALIAARTGMTFTVTGATYARIVGIGAVTFGMAILAMPGATAVTFAVTSTI